MAVCPTPNCGEKLATHSRRLYCYKCRATMARWAKRRASEIVQYSQRLTRNVYRIGHIAERKMDQSQAAAKRPVARVVTRSY